MPIAVIAVCHYVKINRRIALADLADVLLCVRLTDVGEMHRHQRIGQGCADSGASGVHQLIAPICAPFARHAAVNLVADLHHPDVHARCGNLRQRIRREGVECAALLRQIHRDPLLRGHLLCRVSPEVAVMEVNDERQSGFLASAGDFHRVRHAAVAAAVASAVLVEWVVPNADAYGVPACFLQQDEQVCRLAVAVAVHNAAVFLAQHGGNIRAKFERCRDGIILRERQMWQKQDSGQQTGE